MFIVIFTRFTALFLIICIFALLALDIHFGPYLVRSGLQCTQLFSSEIRPRVDGKVQILFGHFIPKMSPLPLEDNSGSFKVVETESLEQQLLHDVGVFLTPASVGTFLSPGGAATPKGH